MAVRVHHREIADRIEVRLQRQRELDDDVVPPHSVHDDADDPACPDRFDRAENVVHRNAVARRPGVIEHDAEHR